MSDDLVKRLRQCSATKRDQSIKIMDDAADRIEALEAALAKADALAGAVSRSRNKTASAVSPNAKVSLAAYRQARDATR